MSPRAMELRLARVMPSTSQIDMLALKSICIFKAGGFNDPF